MVLDKLIVVSDFYCNVDDVANNARNQLAQLQGENVKTTAGGNINVGSMQNSMQRYMSHKVTGDFISMVDSHRNGCFTVDLQTVLHQYGPDADWAGLIFLGFQDDSTQGSVTLDSDHGQVLQDTNMLVLFRTRWADNLPTLNVAYQGGGSQQATASRAPGPRPLGSTRATGGTTSSAPVFQVFFFNTHNNHFLASDHHVVLDRLRQHKIIQVLPLEKCGEYIEVAERWAVENNDGSWTRERHQQYPTTDIPVSYLSFNDELLERIRTEVFPVVSKQFLFPVDTLEIQDLFIVKYDANAQNKLDWHRDVSLISFNFALNDGFEGGGTSFTTVDEPVRIKPGELVMHTGKQLHSGNHVTSGIRYIIVGFIRVNDERVDYDFIQRTSRTGITDEDLFRNLLRW